MPNPPLSLIGMAQLQLRRYNEMNTLTRHKHADLIVERARQDASGETEAGWWTWEYQYPGSGVYRRYEYIGLTFHKSTDYRYAMTDKHPRYVPPKPKLKLIDMMALPRGTWVRTVGAIQANREVLGRAMADVLHVLAPADDVSFYFAPQLRIIEQKKFTYWGGGACPVPEGVVCEVVTRGAQTLMFTDPTVQVWVHNAQTVSLYEIIGYRITGVAGGWTDDPSVI